MASPQKVKVYFHVGLGKTGSKFLQHDFFPRLSGIFYIKPHHFSRYKKLAASLKSISHTKGKILFSRELDQQFEQVVQEFAEYYPDAGTIIVLRRHDEWLLSQYKRMIKNGYHIKFSEFFNLQNTGMFSLTDLNFSGKVQLLQQLFSTPPLVLLYDELRSNPASFLEKIAAYLGVPLPATLPNRRRHASYSEKQLRFAYLASAVVRHRPTSNVLLRYLYVYPVRYSILALGALLPEKLTASVDIFPSEEQLQQIREHFKEDWNRCINYAMESAEQLNLQR